MGMRNISSTAGVLAALTIAGALGVYIVATIQPTMNPSLATVNSATVNATVGNIFTQTYTSFNMWPVILIVVIAAVILAVVRLMR